MICSKYKRLDKNDAVMLFVDHQDGLFNIVGNNDPIVFEKSILALIDNIKFFNIPVIITTSFEESPNGAAIEELKAAFPNAPFISRPGEINAWDNKDFVKAVEATGRKQLIIAGIATDVCVTFPTLSALEEGYDVFVVTDACGTFNKDTHLAAILRMGFAGAQLMSWFSVGAELRRDWRGDNMDGADTEEYGDMLARNITPYKYLAQSYKNSKPSQAN